MPRCIKPGGCPYAKGQRLSTLDAVAWAVFRDCDTQWDKDVGLMGAVKSGLKYDRVKIVAESHGFVLNGPLLSRIGRLEKLALRDEVARLNARADDGGQEDPVM